MTSRLDRLDSAPLSSKARGRSSGSRNALITLIVARNKILNTDWQKGAPRPLSKHGAIHNKWAPKQIWVSWWIAFLLEALEVDERWSKQPAAAANQKAESSSSSSGSSSGARAGSHKFGLHDPRFSFSFGGAAQTKLKEGGVEGKEKAPTGNTQPPQQQQQQPKQQKPAATPATNSSSSNNQKQQQQPAAVEPTSSSSSNQQ